jgi:hypothetical protein
MMVLASDGMSAIVEFLLLQAKKIYLQQHGAIVSGDIVSY